MSIQDYVSPGVYDLRKYVLAHLLDLLTICKDEAVSLLPQNAFSEKFFDFSLHFLIYRGR